MISFISLDDDWYFEDFSFEDMILNNNNNNIKGGILYLVNRLPTFVVARFQ